MSLPAVRRLDLQHTAKERCGFEGIGIIAVFSALSIWRYRRAALR